MTTQEHLAKIKARCTELLALAAKRTPGSWMEDAPSVYSDGQSFVFTDEFTTKHDCTFIAACAGNAEAGWRATIAVIDGLQEYTILDDSLQSMRNIIIAAWPEELLNF